MIPKKTKLFIPRTVELQSQQLCVKSLTNHESLALEFKSHELKIRNLQTTQAVLSTSIIGGYSGRTIIPTLQTLLSVRARETLNPKL